MKIGVIGAGPMGTKHCKIYKELGVLYSVTDTIESLAESTSQKFGVNNFTLSQLLDSGVDGVSIAVPTPFHIDIATKCVASGLHCLIEKPISDSLDGVRELIQLVDRMKVIVGIGYVERFNPAFRALQSLVDSGQLGNIISVVAKRTGGLARSATNVVLDLATHDIDLLQALFRRQAKGVESHLHETNGIVDAAQILLDFESTSAVCEANWISPVKIRRIEVTGTLGYCEVNMIKQEIIQYQSNILDEEPLDNFRDFVRKFGDPFKTISRSFPQESLREELKAFILAIESNCPELLVSLPEAYTSLETTLLAAGVT